jgi:hypothetical protein
MINKHLDSEIAYFCKSLTVEKEDFNLPFPELLQSRLLVMERINGKIVGIAGTSRGNSLFLVVKKEHQNQKIGHKLTKKVIENAKRKNYHYITLNVFQSNSRAIHIYRKFGFKILFTNLIGSRKNFFMMFPLDFQGSFYKIYILTAHKLRPISRYMPCEHTLCAHIRQLANKVRDIFLR